MKAWLALLLLLSAAGAQYRTPGGPMLGSAWYPEQWPEARWEADLALMEQAHFNVVRVGEFAWSTEEPSEGDYRLDWLVRAVALAGKHHLKVVMSTPTDAPPAWLTRKYPETLGTNADDKKREHGGRRQFNYADPHYRLLCAEMVRKLGEKFGKDPNVMGWQIGNEYTDESFDAGTVAQWHAFLRARYGTMGNLNEHWSMAGVFDRFGEIPLAPPGGNPGLLLEHKHFVTATWRSFQQNQIDVLRPLLSPGVFITTNIGGLAWSDNWDHYALTADLDLASWDDYVGQGHLDATKNAMLNDFARGWKRENFWVMETQPGSVNWAPVNNALAPGETRALAWQAIGHGADAVLYWQWRAALNGQESYHGAIVGPDGEPLPIYAELALLGADLEKTRAALAGTSPHAEVALLQTYDSRWAIDFQPMTREYDQQQVLLRFYAPLERAAGTVDVIDAGADLSGYRLVVAPSLNVVSDALAEHLLAYVRGGGHLLLGPRSGMKDEYDALNPGLQPGPLAAALGAKVAESYTLENPLALVADGTKRVGERWDCDRWGRNCLQVEGGSFADVWAEKIAITSADTTVDLRYGAGGTWLAGAPAMVTRSVGDGRMTLLGTLPDEQMLLRIVRAQVRNRDGSVHGLYGTVPQGVEVCARVEGKRRVLVAINHGGAEASMTLYGRYQSLLPEVEMTPTFIPTGIAATRVRLAAQGVAVLVWEPGS